MTQYPLTLRALFFDKFLSAFIILGLPVIVLVTVPVFAVLVNEYLWPADIESKPPVERKPPFQIETAPRDQKREIVAPIARLSATNVDERLADADNNVQLIAELLEKNKSDELDKVLMEFGKKYPFGFGVFYSDGHKVLSRGRPEYGGISFDTSALEVTIKNNTVCLNSLPITRNGKLIINAQDICFGGSNPIIHAVRVDNKVAIDIEIFGKVCSWGGLDHRYEAGIILRIGHARLDPDGREVQAAGFSGSRSYDLS